MASSGMSNEQREERDRRLVEGAQKIYHALLRRCDELERRCDELEDRCLGLESGLDDLETQLQAAVFGGQAGDLRKAE